MEVFYKVFVVFFNFIFLVFYLFKLTIFNYIYGQKMFQYLIINQLYSSPKSFVRTLSEVNTAWKRAKNLTVKVT